MPENVIWLKGRNEEKVKKLIDGFDFAEMLPEVLILISVS